MKHACKHLATILLAALPGGCIPALAAVPLRWSVETSRAQTSTFDVYRGETLSLSADVSSYGKPLALAGSVSLYCQTNGMGDSWWILPATVASNRIEAVLSPTNYPGDAQSLNCFLGGPATSYRAAFRLRVLGAPGPAPSEVQFPIRSLDFAHITMTNAPFALNESLPDFSTFALAEDLGGYLRKDGDTMNGDLVFGRMDGIVFNDGSRDISLVPGRGKIGYFVNDIHAGYLATNLTGAAASTAELSTVRDSVSTIEATVAAWQTYWDGDDVRLTVTNYYGSIDLPHLYLEQKVAEGGTNYFKRVWDETARHDAIIERVHAIETNVQEKADRAWGFYDSHSGGYAPDGFTSISSENVIIAGGMAYQRTVTTSGAVWILTANDPTVIGGTSAGYFRISDDDGNALWEIVKGARRTVGATATGLTMSGGAMVVTYTVQADEHPTIYLADSLTDPSWQAEGTSSLASVTWAGASGAWTATVTPIGARPALFAKATYQAGGETYIKNTAPISVEGGIVVGSKKIRPRVNGGTVTWEVIP